MDDYLPSVEVRVIDEEKVVFIMYKNQMFFYSTYMNELFFMDFVVDM